MKIKKSEFIPLEKYLRDHAKQTNQPLTELVEDVLAMLEEAYGDPLARETTGVRQDTV
jgi:hypothetical protein